MQSPIYTFLAASTILGTILSATSSYAQTSVTYSPLTAVAVGPNGPSTAKTKVQPWCCPPTALVIKATQPVTDADFQWVFLGLTVPESVPVRSVTAVEICYALQSPKRDSTYISQTRLTDMTTPNVANVKLDDPTDRLGPGPTCYRVRANFTPRGTLTLHLKVVFANTVDEIRLGMIRLYL